MFVFVGESNKYPLVNFTLAQCIPFPTLYYKCFQHFFNTRFLAQRFGFWKHKLLLQLIDRDVFSKWHSLQRILIGKFRRYTKDFYETLMTMIEQLHFFRRKKWLLQDDFGSYLVVRIPMRQIWNRMFFFSNMWKIFEKVFSFFASYVYLSRRNPTATEMTKKWK